MKKKHFKDGIELSCLGMGAMRLPVKNDGSIDYDKAKEIIDEAYASGINYYDTAYIYHNGHSETFLAKALRDYPRNSYYLADKYNFQANTDYAEEFAEQLQKMQVDYIDFYLLHGIQDNFVNELINSGAIDYFDQMKKSGKIRYFGFSFHGSEESLDKMLNAYDKWDFIQIQLNYYDWEYGNQQALYKKLHQKKIPMMIMEPVHGGLLAREDMPGAKEMMKINPDRSVASWAMRWLMTLDGIQVILSGMGTLAMLRDNVNTFSEYLPLNADENNIVRKAAEAHHSMVALPCTACRYCCPNCPSELNIPSLLVSYNELKVDKAGGAEWRLQKLLGLPKEKRPTNCIGCGSCTEHCPQSINVPAAMEEMADILNNMQ